MSAGLTNKHKNSVIPVHVNQENCACVRYTVPCTVYTVIQSVCLQYSAVNDFFSCNPGNWTSDRQPVASDYLLHGGTRTVYSILYSVFCILYTV